MISKIKALSIARKAIKSKQSKTKYTDFSEIRLNEENSQFWVFVSGSEKMYNDGHIPGAFFVHIDKKDGHILSCEEEASFYQKSAKKNQPIPELQAA